ncbi:HD domain-containing protein [Pseudonocardia eucalypti]|uniref:HD domain-containing protein n=1 Tax=Pseudonocardia eucalypti TaxID=648755 RepID=A0ABP9RD49_9PSEU|nr:hypothetical protein [Pseudonocardia eucalypti]
MGKVDRACALARSLLAEPLPRRWAHTQGVAATARRLTDVLGEQAELIEAAAWLHDIGYSPALVETGLHALDGARYLRDVARAEPMLCGLVAYHTGAIYEAQERGLESQLLDEFDPPPTELSKALTYCDITTSPDGHDIDVRERLDDVLRRYGPDDPVHRTIRKARDFYLASVRDIEARLAS